MCELVSNGVITSSQSVILLETKPVQMEREASPDWLRDFKSPTEDAYMILSSSPSSSSGELAEKVSSKEEFPEVNTTTKVEEESPIVSVLGLGKAARGTQPKEGAPEKRGRPPGQNQKKKGKTSVAESDDNLEDDYEDDEKVISSRRPRRGKRLLDSDEDVDETKPPTKSRKTGRSPKEKREGASKTSTSSRKGKRVSSSEEEETATLKGVKRDIQLETVETAAEGDGDDDDETAPISKLSSVGKTPKQAGLEPASSDSYSVGKSEKDRPGTNALRALMEDEDVDEDGLGLSQKEDPVAVEETGEPSERKPKRVSSTLPVMFADKIHRTKVLVECEGDALDLSGDMGAVGRFTVIERDAELFLDLKGVIYKTTIVPSNTFFVVNVGQTEAKVEAIMNDFMQLRPDVNQAGDETVVEGTLEDFGFDVDNDGDGGAAPNGTPPAEADDDEDDEEKPKKKSPTKGQGKKVVAGKGAKAQARQAGKGVAKKPRGKGKAKAKTAAKKPAKSKPAGARKPKATKG